MKTDIPLLTISRPVNLGMINVSYKSCRENQIPFYIQKPFLRISCRLWNNVGKKILYSRTDHRWQFGACALRAGYLRLQTHPQST